MAKFRDVKTLQKFAAAHASIHNHFNQERISTAAISSSRIELPRSLNGVNSPRESLDRF